MKEFADDNLKFDENGRKFSKNVANYMGKGGIARYEQYLLFPHFLYCIQVKVKRRTCLGKVYWDVTELLYFTHVLLVGRPYLWCQDEHHLSRSRSNIKVMFLKEQ